MRPHGANRSVSKKWIILSAIIVVLAIIRLIIPSVILKKTNKFLATFSPNYSLHINDLRLHIFRGAYSFHGVTGKLKEDEKKFLEIDTVDVSLAWREIFKGKLKTDIEADGVRFLVIKDIKKLKAPKKEEKETAKRKLFPLKIERFDLHDGSLTLEGYEALDEKTHFTINDINGRATNLVPDDKNKLSYFNITAKIVDPDAILKVAGELNMTADPLQWDFDAELRNFHLNLMNPYFKKHMPLSFTKGTLDLYSEVISKEGKMKGYAKPFIRELDVVANKEHFKNAKHFGFELISALGNLILREKKTKSVATKMEFTFDKKFQLNTGKTIKKAIQHGFEQQLSPGIDDQYKLE